MPLLREEVGEFEADTAGSACDQRIPVIAYCHNDDGSLWIKQENYAIHLAVFMKII
jgi:hypothetical protein